jgi:hypothetical protein
MKGRACSLLPMEFQACGIKVVVMESDMFSLLAILVVILSVGSIPIITTLLFIKTGREDLESQRELLATAVQVEKIQMSWRARHQTPDRER